VQGAKAFLVILAGEPEVIADDLGV